MEGNKLLNLAVFFLEVLIFSGDNVQDYSEEIVKTLAECDLSTICAASSSTLWGWNHGLVTLQYLL